MAVAAVNLALAAAFLMKSTDPFEGVLERIFYTLALLWVEWVSLLHLRPALRWRRSISRGAGASGTPRREIAPGME